MPRNKVHLKDNLHVVAHNFVPEDGTVYKIRLVEVNAATPTVLPDLAAKQVLVINTNTGTPLGERVFLSFVDDTGGDSVAIEDGRFAEFPGPNANVAQVQSTSATGDITIWVVQ